MKQTEESEKSELKSAHCLIESVSRTRRHEPSQGSASSENLVKLTAYRDPKLDNNLLVAVVTTARYDTQSLALKHGDHLTLCPCVSSF